MSKFTLIRLGSTLLLTMITITGPWWLAGLWFIVGAWFFPNYYEAIIAGLFFDLLYGGAGLTVFGFQFIVSLLIILLVALINELKVRVVFAR